MRRRRSERRGRRSTPRLGARTGAATTLLVASFGVAVPAAAQSSEAGASFLLVPFDARNVGLGGAGVADPVGTNALFINPAGYARLTHRDALLDYAVDQVGTRVTASYAQASRVLGTFAAGVYRYSLGTQELTDINGVVTGTLSIADYAFAASYAVGFTSRFSAGVTAKVVQYAFDCTGECDPTVPRHPSTGALDGGVQFDVDSAKRVHVGLAVRNLGLRLQTKDRAQADPLPTQIAAGVGWDVPGVERYVPEATLRVMADASTPLGVRLERMYHVGVEAVYRKTVSVRAGYAERSGYGGPALGFGVTSSHFTLDVARQLTTSALFADKPPTYVGLRYTF
ncbi:hypothetical protein J421_3207 [Gemmatirosa kalamazoonensis]|uniref:Type IX secretion system protein PorV domain-containing protein n=1 Tax=Gemmatirosa kalamazoonensis TaxID=861299 RepID=W0RI34_9BACT|nr:PorV/PorQ family protein [Gemmatirosa kalamazoonensis]AHG90744.1 hypothetical protein J421_3207 [Gemmatirosa kalamazoonensis]